jgi:hypothetical protein
MAAHFSVRALPKPEHTNVGALGVETWTEPVEKPVDRYMLSAYDLDEEVLERWRVARREYLSLGRHSSAILSGRGGECTRHATSWISCSTAALDGGRSG